MSERGANEFEFSFETRFEDYSGHIVDKKINIFDKFPNKFIFYFFFVL